MDLLEKLNNKIVITSYNYKMDILKKLSKENKLYNITFLTKEELIKKLCFSYDENAIYYLMDKHNLKQDIAEIYLKNMYYIENKDYENTKLNTLVKLKNELEENNLLEKDSLFIENTKNKTIVFYNYDYLNLLDLNIIEKLKEKNKVEIIEKEYKENTHTVYEFDTIIDEVEFIAKEIHKLLEQNISIDKIKLTNVDDDYTDILTRIFNMYNLKVNISNDKLISTNIAYEFLNNNGSLEEKVKSLNEKYKNNEVLNQIVKIVNKYVSFKNEEVVNEMIISDFKSTNLKKENYKNTIEVINYKDYEISDDMYIFMPNFNQNKIPISYKDEEFITDNLKENLLLEDTLTKNKIERETTIKNIKNIKNLIITYKKTTPFSSFYPSNLITDLGYEVKTNNLDLKLSYSPLSDKIRLSQYIDEYIKSGNVKEKLKLLYSNYDDIKYNTYLNKYTGISKDLFKEYIDNSFNLAYSSMDNFYKCPFKYYLSNVLKINIYEETFDTYIGSMFHYCLEKGLQEEKSVDDLIEKFINQNERELSKKEKFYVNKIKEDIRFTLEVIKEQIENSNLKQMLFEDKVEVIKEGDIKVTFKGFIDKIVYEEKDNEMIVAIIDYKTGFTDINLGFVNEGLSMQLPVYLYLAKNSNKLKNVRFAGFYLQKVLSSLINIDSKKSYEDIKRENLLLYGYSNSDHDTIYEFDNTYKESRFIKSMKLDSKGEFSRYSKILSDEKIEKLIDITDKKIDEAIEKISNREFDIKPKRTEKELLGCKFCKFNDICFKEKSDELLIYEDKDLSYLGGEENA